MMCDNIMMVWYQIITRLTALKFILNFPNV